MRKVLFTALFLTTLPFFCANAQEISSQFSFPEKMALEIKAAECLLTVYRQHEDGSRDAVAQFPVATARKGISQYPFGKGSVVKVDIDPYWYPTNNLVEYMNKKLVASGKKALFKKGEAIGPADPRNAMGTFKMHLSHFVPGNGNVYRIHGTNAPGSIGKRASSGCIRMKNSDGQPLAKNVKERLQRGEKIQVDII